LTRPRWRRARVAPRLAWAGALALALLLPPLLPGASAQTPAAPAPPALDQLVGPLYQQLAGVKGIASPGPPPPVQVRTRAEARRFIDQEIDRQYPPDRLEAERKGLVVWGLIPAHYDLRRLFVDLMQEQLAAYYDPRGKVMVVGDWLTPAEQHVALLHELVHALQDTQVSLERFMAPTLGRSDRVLARQALVEGEAVAIMFEIIMRAQGIDFVALPDLGLLRSSIAGSSTGPAIGRAPPYLRDMLLFPYVEGVQFVHRFRKREGYPALARLFQDPPRSSAQILHPAKWLDAREDPLPVGAADLAPEVPGLAQVLEDELGEFGLGAALRALLGEDAARRAAESWRGDRFRLWQDGAGRLVLLARFAVASDGAAISLAAHLRGLVELRHPALRGGARRTAGLTTWADGALGFAVEQRGAEVVLVEQVPAVALERARSAAWRAPPPAP